MLDLTKLKQTLRELVTDEGMEAALAELEKHLPTDVPKYNMLLQLKARHKEIDNQRIKNVVSNEQATLQYDKLRDEILTFFSGLQESDFSAETAKKANMGGVLYRIPDKMQHQKKTKCIVRVAYDEALLKDTLDTTVDVTIEALKVSKNMEVKLVDEEGDGEYFEITSRSTPEQFLVQDEFTEWTFFVKPLEIGTYPLALIISLIIYEDGKDRKKDITLERVINIITEPVPEEAGDHTMRKAGILFALTDRPAPGDGGEKAPKKKPWTKVAIGVLLALLLGWLLWAMFKPDEPGLDAISIQEKQDFDAAVAQDSPELLIGFLAKYQNSEFDGQARDLVSKKFPRMNVDSAVTVFRQTHKVRPVDRSETTRSSTYKKGSKDDPTDPSNSSSPNGDDPSTNGGDNTPGEVSDGPNGGATDPNTPTQGGGTSPTGGSVADPNNPAGGAGNPANGQVSAPSNGGTTSGGGTQGGGTPDGSGDPAKLGPARWDNKVMAKEDPINWLPTTMVKVKGGTFKMGCSLKLESTGCAATAEPSHDVKVAEFSISRFEVTQALWAAVMGENNNPSRFDDCDLCPVEQVSWDDAQQFIKKLNRKTGLSYRLPTEAEWEYAARQAGKDNRFGDGTNIAKTTNFNFNSEDLPDRKFVVKGESRLRTVDIFMLKANALGLFQMSGNVAEWCQDRWHPDYEGAPADGSAWLDGNDNRRVIRGGAWDSEPYAARTYDRDAKKASTKDDEVGFRLVW
jgi:formylglycine-generating enzyme required for sulfatase activity